MAHFTIRNLGSDVTNVYRQRLDTGCPLRGKGVLTLTQGMFLYHNDDRVLIFGLLWVFWSGNPIRELKLLPVGVLIVYMVGYGLCILQNTVA